MSDTLRITRPCDRTWRDLTGDHTRRFCGDCQKWVYNLDLLSRADIDALRRAGGLCGMYLGDEAGAFRLPPEESPRVAASIAAVLVASIVAGCSSDPSSTGGLPSPAPTAISSHPPAACESKPEAKDALAGLSPEEERTRQRLEQLGYVE